jgi:hypothetical protein
MATSCMRLVQNYAEAQVSQCGIRGGQSGTETRISPSSSFSPVNIIPPWLSILMYHLGDEQQARWWLQFRDVVSPHRQNDNNNKNRLEENNSLIVRCEMMMKAVRTSETSVYSETTHRYIPEDS